MNPQFRCFNDIFGYCDSTPPVPEINYMTNAKGEKVFCGGNTCPETSAKCGHYLTNSQVNPALPPIAKAAKGAKTETVVVVAVVAEPTIGEILTEKATPVASVAVAAPPAPEEKPKTTNAPAPKKETKPKAKSAKK